MRPEKSFLSLFSALFIAATFLCAPAFSAGPEVVKITESVYAFIGERGGTNSGFVVTDRGVVVIDTQGPSELAVLLREKIKKVTEKPIVYAINTHWHGDHTFGNQYFAEAHEIIAHESTMRDLAEKDAAHRERFKRFFGEESLEGFILTLPTLTFSEALTLRVGEKTFIITFPGPAHTYGDAYVFIPEDRVVFAGDLLYKDRLPWLADGEYPGALRAAAELLALDADTYIPGHGGAATAGDVRAYMNYLSALGVEVKRLRNLGKTVEEVKKEVTLPEYSGYMNYKEWLPLNAEKVFLDLEKE